MLPDPIGDLKSSMNTSQGNIVKIVNIGVDGTPMLQQFNLKKELVPKSMDLNVGASLLQVLAFLRGVKGSARYFLQK